MTPFSSSMGPVDPSEGKKTLVRTLQKEGTNSRCSVKGGVNLKDSQLKMTEVQ